MERGQGGCKTLPRGDGGLGGNLFSVMRNLGESGNFGDTFHHRMGKFVGGLVGDPFPVPSEGMGAGLFPRGAVLGGCPFFGVINAESEAF